MRDDNGGGWWRRSPFLLCPLDGLTSVCTCVWMLFVGQLMCCWGWWFDSLQPILLGKIVISVVCPQFGYQFCRAISIKYRAFQSINCSSWKDDGFSIRMADVVGSLQIFVGWLGCLHINSTGFSTIDWFCWFLFTILPLFLMSSVLVIFLTSVHKWIFLLVTSQMYKDWLLLLLLPFYTLQSSEGSDSSQGALVDIGEEVGVRCWFRRQSCLPSCSSWWCVIINNYY